MNLRRRLLPRRLVRILARTLAERLDKTEQCSEWAARPLRRAQLLYAALDAHILLRIHDTVSAR